MPALQSTELDQPNGHTGRSLLRRFELPVLLLLLLAVFLVNLATSSRFPLPWQDEDVFVDIATNFAWGHGFTSSVATCGSDPSIFSFYSCNSPLFSLLLSGWIKLFGLTIPAVRALNYLLISLDVFLLWLASRRLRLIARSTGRLAFAVLLLTGYGMGFIFRSARYDCLGMLLLALVLLAFSIPRRPLRLGVIALLGALFAVTGIQLILYTIVLSVLVLAVYRGRFFAEVFTLAGGTFAGGLGLLAIFAANGGLQRFFQQLLIERADRFAHLAKDPSFLMLFLACALVAIYRARNGSFRIRSVLGFGMLTGALVPVGMVALGKFPIYYSWMALVPMAMAACAGIFALEQPPAGWAGKAAQSCLVLACLLGVPVQIASALYYWHDRDCDRIEAMVQREIKPNDWVYAYYSSIFAVRRVTPYVFVPFTIPAKYRDRITVMVVSPEDFDSYAHAIVGGEWADTGDAIVDRSHDVFPNNSFAILLQRRINLRVYRRTGPRQQARLP